MLLYAPDGPVDVATYERAAAAAVTAAHGRMDVYLITAPGADITATGLPLTPNGGDVNVTFNGSGIFKV